MYYLFIFFLAFLIAMTILILHFSKRVWGNSNALLVLAGWLVPAYPLAYLIAHAYPKDEACGFAGFCVGALIGFVCSIAWLILFPIIASLVANFKWRQKQIASGLKMTAKNYYLEFGIGIFILLCLALWFTSASSIFFG